MKTFEQWMQLRGLTNRTFQSIAVVFPGENIRMYGNQISIFGPGIVLRLDGRKVGQFPVESIKKVILHCNTLTIEV